MEIGDYIARYHRRKNDDRCHPEIERNNRQTLRKDEFLLLAGFIDQSNYPSGEKWTQQKRSYAGKDEQESGPESHICRRIDQRKSGRYDNGSGKIREEGEGSEVLD